MLKESQSRFAFAELEKDKDKLGNCPVNLYEYISNNVKNMDYVAYKEKGYFIDSGSIEGGNKIVLQERLKRVGMRWNIPTAQAMLTLRAKAESNLWHQDVEVPF